MSDLNVVGGHVALDLVNTVDPRTPGREAGNEHLPTPEALLKWAVRVHLVSAAEAAQIERAWRADGAGQPALRSAIEIREAAYDVLLGVLGTGSESVVEDALTLLRDRWAAAIGRSALRLAGDGGPGGDDRLHLGADPGLLIPDRLADAAVGLLRTDDLRQLKACPLDEGGCGWLFLDRSHNQSRRWCAMEDCGARAKARRLTARRRAGRAAGTSRGGTTGRR